MLQGILDGDYLTDCRPRTWLDRKMVLLNMCIFASQLLGSTTPTVTWAKLEGPLPESSVIGQGTLVIPQVRPEDAGTYQCTATNQAGAVRTRVQLIVLGKYTITVTTVSIFWHALSHPNHAPPTHTPHSK